MGAKKTYIHIGLHKTGTTYLQRNYFNSLLNVTFFSYHLKYDQICNLDRIYDNVLISNEGLSGLAWNKKWIRGILNNYHWMGSFNRAIMNTKSLYPNASIIVVFRRHGDLLVSMYKQYIQEGGILPFDKFYGDNKVITKDDLCFEKRIKILQDTFSNVYVLSYEDFIEKGDTYFNWFFKSLNIDSDSFNKKKGLTNRSVSGYKIDLMRRFNYFYLFLPNWVRSVCTKIRLTPRDIFQFRFANWRPKDSQELNDRKDEINREFEDDWNSIAKYFFSD